MRSTTEVRERLGHLRTLRAGWHSGEGAAVSGCAVEGALSFAEARPALVGRSRFFPTLAGGIQLEFDSAAVDLELEFGADGSVGLLWSRDAGETCGEDAFDGVSERLLLAVDSRVGGSRASPSEAASGVTSRRTS